MPVPSSMSNLSLTAGSNSPAGSEAIGNSLDDYLRGLSSIVRSTYSLASATIAAASTTDVATADAESVQVTGAATITSLGTGFTGCRREVRFAGICTLTNSANIVLPGGANIITAAGDVLTFRCTGSGVWTLIAKSREAALTSSQVTTALGYTPVNKAGDTMTGALAAPSLGPSAGVQGFQFAWNAVASGNGATEFINNRGAGGGGFGWYDRVDTSGGAGSALMLLNSTGLSVGTITIGLGGKKLSKITLSTSAPGVLADGELYLRY